MVRYYLLLIAVANWGRNHSFDNCRFSSIFYYNPWFEAHLVSSVPVRKRERYFKAIETKLLWLTLVPYVVIVCSGCALGNNLLYLKCNTIALTFNSSCVEVLDRHLESTGKPFFILLSMVRESLMESSS